MKPQRLVVRMLVQDQNERSLLVQNRGQDFWYPPGGGLEPAETLAQAAVREVLEETGVRARVERLLFVVEFLDPRLDEQNIEFFFLGTLEGYGDDGHEHAMRWFERREMLNNPAIFPTQLRQPEWGGALLINQNLYFGVERG